MKVYPASAIHNVAVVGHNGVGKTTLVSALLHEAGATPRFGRVEEGNAPTDFDPEEVERKISIGLAVASLEWKKKKINLIDTPGYGIFVSEMLCGLRAADAAIIVVDAVAGVEVQTEKAWKVCDELGLPRLVVVNRMDRDRADGGRVMDQLQKKFGRACVCVEAPIGKEKGFRGVIDLVAMQGWLTDDAGKTAAGAIPDEFAADAAQLHESLVEMVAEGDDKLMETFFSQGNLSEEQMKPALKKAIQRAQDRSRPLHGERQPRDRRRKAPRRDRGPAPDGGHVYSPSRRARAGRPRRSRPTRRARRPRSSSRRSPTRTRAGSRSSASTRARSRATAPTGTPRARSRSASAPSSRRSARRSRRCRTSRPATSAASRS